MSLLTELEILGAGFLQRWRAYGAADAMDEVGGHEPITISAALFLAPLS